jgi:hypothetical protein
MTANDNYPLTVGEKVLSNAEMACIDDDADRIERSVFWIDLPECFREAYCEASKALRSRMPRWVARIEIERRVNEAIHHVHAEPGQLDRALQRIIKGADDLDNMRG